MAYKKGSGRTPTGRGGLGIKDLLKATGRRVSETVDTTLNGGTLSGGTHTGGTTLAALALRPDPVPLITEHLESRYSRTQLQAMEDIAPTMGDVYGGVLAMVGILAAQDAGSDIADDIDALTTWLSDFFNADAWVELFDDQNADMMEAAFTLGLSDTDQLRGVPDFLLMQDTLSRVLNNANFQRAIIPDDISDKTVRWTGDALLMWYRDFVLEDAEDDFRQFLYDYDDELPNFIADAPINQALAVETYTDWVEGTTTTTSVTTTTSDVYTDDEDGGGGGGGGAELATTDGESLPAKLVSKARDTWDATPGWVKGAGGAVAAAGGAVLTALGVRRLL